MTELERLEQRAAETMLSAQAADKNIEEGYKKLLVGILTKIGFSENYIKSIHSDIRTQAPKAEYDNFDRLEIVFVEDPRKLHSYTHSMTVQVATDKVRLNGIAVSYWDVDSWSYIYMKFMVAIAEEGKMLSLYCKSVDRTPLQEAHKANEEYENEKYRIESEAEEIAQNQFEESFKNVQYIGKYRKYEWYQDEYDRDNPDKTYLATLYKVVKETAKKFAVVQLYQDNSDRPNLWSNRYPSVAYLKKEQVFFRDAMYAPITENDIEVELDDSLITA